MTVTGSPLGRQVLLGVLVMVAAGLAPALLLGPLGSPAGTSIAGLGGMSAFIACIRGRGWPTGVLMAFPFAAFAGASVWVAADPWPAALVLAAAAFLRGYAARLGLHDALMMSVISLAFIVAQPPQPDIAMPAPAYAAVVALASTLWASLVVFLVRRWIHPRPTDGLDRIRVLVFSAALAVMVGVATWFVVRLELGHGGAWIILTMVIVFQPSLGAGFAKAGQRAAGTLLGFAIVVGIGLVRPSGPFLAVLGMAFLITALSLTLTSRPYWMYATCLTPAIVLLESAGSSVSRLAEMRLGATLIGVAATVVVMLALAPLGSLLAEPSAEAPRAAAT